MLHATPSVLFRVLGGTGSLGSVLSTRLSPSSVLTRRNDVTKVVEVNLKMSDSSGQDLKRVIDVEGDKTGMKGVVICTLKGYDVNGGLEALVEECLEKVGERGDEDGFTVVMLSNGLLAVYDELVGKGYLKGRGSPVDAISLGSTSIGATKLSDTKEGDTRRIEVLQTGWGDTVLGPPVWVKQGVDAARCEGEIKDLAGAMVDAGFPTRVVGRGVEGDIWTVLWMKLCVNCLINPIAAVEGVTNEHVPGLLGEGEGSLRDRVVGELVEVGNADLIKRGSDFRLERGEVVEGMMRVVENTMNNRNSMLQDVEKGRRTEIDTLNGWVVRRGEEEGIACDGNRWLWEEIKRIEGGG
jgi:2-dehydropantoate 2-reductase